jgi:hypothetical protein
MKEFELFSDDGLGVPGDIKSVMKLIQHAVEDHDMPFQEALGYICDMVRPGNSEHSHDVKPLFVGAMFAYGYGHLCDNFGAIYLNSMPWGIGFNIGVLPEFDFNSCSADEQRAIIQGFAVILRCGGMEVTVGDDNRLILHNPDDGEVSEMSMDSIVGQFRREMDKELGPDAPEDPTRRWMP